MELDNHPTVQDNFEGLIYSNKGRHLKLALHPHSPSSKFYPPRRKNDAKKKENAEAHAKKIYLLMQTKENAEAHAKKKFLLITHHI